MAMQLEVSGSQFSADASDFGCKNALEAFGPLLASISATSDAVSSAQEGRAPQLAEGKKRLQRAKMLHAVITQKLTETEAIASLKNILKMSVEWLHGMLDITFALEASMIDDKFKNSALLVQTLSQLDSGNDWVSALAAMYGLASLVKQPKAVVLGSSAADGESSSSNEKPSEEQVQALLQKAASGGAAFKDVNDDKTVQAQLLGVELWEAICWRRGSLRSVGWELIRALTVKKYPFS
jgi:hypothetical protein